MPDRALKTLAIQQALRPRKGVGSSPVPFRIMAAACPRGPVAAPRLFGGCPLYFLQILMRLNIGAFFNMSGKTMNRIWLPRKKTESTRLCFPSGVVRVASCSGQGTIRDCQLISNMQRCLRRPLTFNIKFMLSSESSR